MLNCIAVDDEKLILELLADDIRQVPFLHLVATCRSALEAIELLHHHEIDLIFLDIQMPGLNGFQFIGSLQNPPMVVFITAYREYAFDGFNVNAVDYLLKPVGFDRFLKACNKAYTYHQGLQNKPEKNEGPDYFFVYVEYNQVKITIDEILYIEGMKDYVKIFITASSKPVITRLNLKAMEEKLAGYRFVRSHKSYIISADKVTAIKRDLLCIGNIELPLSEKYKPGVENMLAR
ncbi:MAG TPA: LytTR family DNA-binding domain-containing protein [Chitinophagaceae bacterium]|jgi:DNA-binding LytR/AlgR family response regulator|nr:LytTR family DNA-binding domain-containing protein [Chitinophagaceae bacterium]